jgi:hypothetical protein
MRGFHAFRTKALYLRVCTVGTYPAAFFLSLEHYWYIYGYGMKGILLDQVCRFHMLHITSHSSGYSNLQAWRLFLLSLIYSFDGHAGMNELANLSGT